MQRNPHTHTGAARVSLDISLSAVRTTTVFDANFTHNVTPMWKKAGIYDALYNSHGMTAAEVLPALRSGLEDMRANRQAYTDLNASNGWGTYAHALPWLENLVESFEANPDGIIRVWK